MSNKNSQPKPSPFDLIADLQQRIESQAEEIAAQRRRIAELENAQQTADAEDLDPRTLLFRKAWGFYGLLVANEVIPLPTLTCNMQPGDADGPRRVHAQISMCVEQIASAIDLLDEY